MNITQFSFKAPQSPVRSIITADSIQTSKKPLTRRDIERNYETKRAVSCIVDKFRVQKPIVLKTANVKKIKSGYRIIGFNTLELDKISMKKFLKEQGYSRMRIGGLVFSL